MQKERTTKRQTEVVQAQKALEACELNDIIPNFQILGFDFSAEEMQAYLSTAPKFFALSGGKTLNFDAFLKELRTEDKVEAA